MKMISSTRKTSVSGVMLISATTDSLPRRRRLRRPRMLVFELTLMPMGRLAPDGGARGGSERALAVAPACTWPYSPQRQQELVA